MVQDDVTQNPNQSKAADHNIGKQRYSARFYFRMPGSTSHGIISEVLVGG